MGVRLDLVLLLTSDCLTIKTMAFKIYRLLLLITINLAALFFFMPLWLLLKPFKLLHQGMVDRAVRLWARLSCYALGIELRGGGPVMDGKGLFIVSNHLSYTDIPVLASLFSCVFVSKVELRQWPLFGILSAMAGTIFVDRTSRVSTIKAIKEAERSFSINKSIVLFPEATTSDGNEIRPFKSAFFALPERMGTPILPIAIKYYDPKTNRVCKHVPWYGKMDIFRHLWRLLGVRRICAVVRFCEIIYPSDNPVPSRKMFASMAEQRIKEAYYSNGS